MGEVAEVAPFDLASLKTGACTSLVAVLAGWWIACRGHPAPPTWVHGCMPAMHPCSPRSSPSDPRPCIHTPEDVVRERAGDVLLKNTLLKADHFPGAVVCVRACVCVCVCVVCVCVMVMVVSRPSVSAADLWGQSSSRLNTPRHRQLITTRPKPQPSTHLPLNRMPEQQADAPVGGRPQLSSGGGAACVWGGHPHGEGGAQRSGCDWCCEG